SHISILLLGLGRYWRRIRNDRNVVAHRRPARILDHVRKFARGRFRPVDSRVNPWSDDARRRAPGSLPGNGEERLVCPWAGDNQREVLRLVDLDSRHFPDRHVTAAQRMTLDS